MAVYGILGSGSCAKNVIEDGLKDIGIENNVFLVVLRKGASDNEDRVYEFLMENEADFHAFTNSKAPQIIKDSASRIHEFDDNETMFPHLLKELKDKKGTLLLMWNNETADALTNICFDAYDLGIPVLELSNGLVPINVVAEPTEGEEPDEEEVVEIEPFTEAEMRSMSIGVLRKAATAHGIEGVGAYSKEELLMLLVDTKAHQEKLEEDVEVKIPVPTTQVVTTTPVPHDRKTLEAPEGDCMVTVVMPNGTVISTPATMGEVRLILGLG